MQPGRSPRDTTSLDGSAFASDEFGSSPQGDLDLSSLNPSSRQSSLEDPTETELPRDTSATERPPASSSNSDRQSGEQFIGQELLRRHTKASGSMPSAEGRNPRTQPRARVQPEIRSSSGTETEIDSLPRDTLRDLRLSSGYYSRTDAQVESIEVTIPRAPRVPKIEEPAPPSSQSPHSDRMPREGARRRVLIGATLRRQADSWLLSGSLELPTTASPRHARAKQRALLVALLMEPGFDNLPLGLQQRASWLLRAGWGVGAGERDVDDCLTCLGIEATPDTRRHLVEALEHCVPEVDLPPPSSRNSYAPSSFAGSGSRSPSSLNAGSTVRVTGRPTARSSSPAQERPTSRPPRRS